ncbi:MAG: 4-hydroxy-tetrahydrodipicolinate synthase [Lachnospiraceae bacterium]|nr:4-hydroxy-tetrahydrodipicolinate synthase [Lachnospiraceae bacterium]
MSIFKGAGVAIATPFHEDGSVNYEEFDRLIDYDINGGADAIIVCGTTGESATMTLEEHSAVVRHCIEYVNHRVPIIAGSGSNDTQAAIGLSKQAEADGADGLLVVTPYYNKATQKGLIAHYTAVAESVHTPCIMYNVPSRTGCNIQPATAAYLGKNVKNIVAIKAASGNISQIEETKALAGDALDIYSGNDDQVLPILACGGIGVISVLANVAPKETHAMCQKFFDGDIAGSRDIQYRALPLIHALFSEVNPIPVKEALNYIGIAGGPLRLPLTTIEPEHAAVLKQAMIDFGIPVVD